MGKMKFKTKVDYQFALKECEILLDAEEKGQTLTKEQKERLLRLIDAIEAYENTEMLADKMIKMLKEAGYKYEEMPEVFRLARKIYNEMKTNEQR